MKHHHLFCVHGGLLRTDSIYCAPTVCQAFSIHDLSFKHLALIPTITPRKYSLFYVEGRHTEGS